MSKSKSLLGLLLALALVAGLVTGVAYLSLDVGMGGDEPGLYLDGKRVEDVDPVLTLGEYEIPYNLYRYFYLTVRYTTSGGDDSYWNHDPDGSRAQALKDEVEEYISYYFTWMAIADEYGIELSEEELANIDSTIQSQKDTYGTSFGDMLAGYFIADEDTYRQVNRMEELTTKVVTEFAYQLTAENREELLASVVTVQHLLVSDANFQEEAEQEAGDEAQADGEPEDSLDAGLDAGLDEVEPDDEAEAGEPEDTNGEGTAEEEPTEQETAASPAMERARQFAQGLLDEIRASSDPIATFRELRAEHDEDQAGQEANDGYTFGEGTMVEAFYQAAVALDINEISDLVPTTYGYHILLRMPLDESQVATDEDLYMLVYSTVDEMMMEIYEGVQERLAPQPGKYYDEITPFTVQ